jgi:hypothetical protein
MKLPTTSQITMMRFLLKTMLTLVVAALFLLEAIAAPTIHVWYGLNQAFGQRGNPQAAINILGNVSDPNGILSFSYTLNGGSPVNLNRGPDTRRLLMPGDFNIDIATDLLNAGTNTIVITATNSLNDTATETVTVQYTAGQTWPLPYTIDWSAASSIQSVAQVIDGKWEIANGVLRPVELGYDRLVGIGDRTWTDYEITVPITIRGLDTSGFNGVSQTPGVGFLFRWPGHSDNPFPGNQPKTGFLPYGAIGWYTWQYGNTGFVNFMLLGNNLVPMQSDQSGFRLTFGVTYIFKMRVETVIGQGGFYRFKVWEAAQPEPGEWRLQGQQSLSDPQAGSVCLLSHHVAAEFGNVTVTALSPLPVQLSRFTATVQSASQVLLNWTTLSEINNYGFEVQKKAAGGAAFVSIPNSFTPGHGTTLTPQHYSFLDVAAAQGSWRYRLKQMDLDGTVHFSEPVSVSVVTEVRDDLQPLCSSLEQNYPNPFNPVTVIPFSVGTDGPASLRVYDLLGQEIATLVNGNMKAGRYDLRFDGSTLPSGIYIYRLQTGRFTQARKLVLSR